MTSPTARKRHQCDWCLQDVVAGEVYERWTGLWDGDFATMKMHVVCKAAAWRDHGQYDDLDELCSDSPHEMGVSCTDLPLGKY